MKLRSLLFALPLIIATACDSTPNYAGNYTASIVMQGDCDLPGWVNGQTFANNPIVITTDPSDIPFAKVEFGGAFGDYLVQILAIKDVQDFAHSSGFQATMFGAKQVSGGTCPPAQVDGFVTLKLDGDALSGGIDLSRNEDASCTTPSPACSVSIAGTRPASK
jgi:hypothetical protein